MHKFLEKMALDYLEGDIDFIENSDTDEEKKFYKKYIDCDENSEIESDFLATISVVQRKGFVDGFKACVGLFSECIEKEVAVNA